MSGTDFLKVTGWPEKQFRMAHSSEFGIFFIGAIKNLI
jgi:hypothetical protein